MYAIIESCGRQYKVVEGDIVFFEKLDVEVDKKITFDKVIMISDDKETKVGNPYVKDVKVEGKVISHGKGKKIIVFKFKAKKNYRRKQGHRQPYTKVEITSIKQVNKVEKANKEETKKNTILDENKSTVKSTEMKKEATNKKTSTKETVKS